MFQLFKYFRTTCWNIWTTNLLSLGCEPPSDMLLPSWRWGYQATQYKSYQHAAAPSPPLPHLEGDKHHHVSVVAGKIAPDWSLPAPPGRVRSAPSPLGYRQMEDGSHKIKENNVHQFRKPIRQTKFHDTSDFVQTFYYQKQAGSPGISVLSSGCLWLLFRGHKEKLFKSLVQQKG